MGDDPSKENGNKSAKTAPFLDSVTKNGVSFGIATPFLTVAGTPVAGFFIFPVFLKSKQGNHPFISMLVGGYGGYLIYPSLPFALKNRRIFQQETLGSPDPQPTILRRISGFVFAVRGCLGMLKFYWIKLLWKPKIHSRRKEVFCSFWLSSFSDCISYDFRAVRLRLVSLLLL